MVEFISLLYFNSILRSASNEIVDIAKLCIKLLYRHGVWSPLLQLRLVYRRRTHQVLVNCYRKVNYIQRGVVMKCTDSLRKTKEGLMLELWTFYKEKVKAKHKT